MSLRSRWVIRRSDGWDPVATVGGFRLMGDGAAVEQEADWRCCLAIRRERAKEFLSSRMVTAGHIVHESLVDGQEGVKACLRHQSWISVPLKVLDSFSLPPKTGFTMAQPRGVNVVILLIAIASWSQGLFSRRSGTSVCITASTASLPAELSVSGVVCVSAVIDLHSRRS